MISEVQFTTAFGFALKQERLRQKLTLANLSMLSGLSVVYLSEIERGRKPPPPTLTVAKICNALKIQPLEMQVLAYSDRGQIKIPPGTPHEKIRRAIEALYT